MHRQRFRSTRSSGIETAVTEWISATLGVIYWILALFLVVLVLLGVATFWSLQKDDVPDGASKSKEMER